MVRTQRPVCLRPMSLTFNLFIPKPNQFIFVLRCTSDKSLAKIRRQCLRWISLKETPRMILTTFLLTLWPWLLTFWPQPEYLNSLSIAKMHDKSFVKIHQYISQISRKQHPERTDARRNGRHGNIMTPTPPMHGEGIKIDIKRRNRMYKK